MMRASVLAAMAVGLASMGAADALSIRADKASPAETVPVTVYVCDDPSSLAVRSYCMGLKCVPIVTWA